MAEVTVQPEAPAIVEISPWGAPSFDLESGGGVEVEVFTTGTQGPKGDRGDKGDPPDDPGNLILYFENGLT